MKLHEFQAKEIFRKAGIPTPNGQVVTTAGQAGQATEDISGPPWVVKAQVHAGGRGKGGGVKVIKEASEVAAAAGEIRNIAKNDIAINICSVRFILNSPNQQMRFIFPEN